MNGKSKMNIVIWGCGTYGKYLYEIFNSHYTDQYNVIGFGDKEYESLNAECNDSELAELIDKSEGKHVLGYSEVKELSDTGKLDGIIVGILNSQVRKQAEDALSILGIQLLDDKCINWNCVACDYDKKCSTKNGRLDIYIKNNVTIYSHRNWNKKASVTGLFDDNYNLLLETDRYIGLSNHPLYYTVFPKGELITASILLEKAFSLLEWGSDFNYGHFVFSCMSRLHIMESEGFDGKYLIYNEPFIREWVELVCGAYGIPRDKFMFIDTSKCDAIFFVKKLYTLKNINDASEINSFFLKQFSEKVLSYLNMNHQTNEKFFPARIYLARKNNRRLIGRKKIADKYEFTVEFLEEKSVVEQVLLMANAEIVLAEHGAAVANCLFMRKGSVLIETFGSGFVDAFFVEMAKIKGMKYRMLVSQKEYADYYLEDDYYIHPALIEMTIEELIK